MIKIFCLRWVTSGIHCEVDDICALLGYYAVYYAAGSSNPKLYSWIARPLKKGPIGGPKTPITNYHHMLRNSPEEHRTLFSTTLPSLL